MLQVCTSIAEISTVGCKHQTLRLLRHLSCGLDIACSYCVCMCEILVCLSQVMCSTVFAFELVTLAFVLYICVGYILFCGVMYM